MNNGSSKDGNCTYATLKTYNNDSVVNGIQSRIVQGPVLSAQVPSMAVQTVPDYKAPSYNTLVGTGSCNGYTGITNAYSDFTKTSGNCTTYKKVPCGGNKWY